MDWNGQVAVVTGGSRGIGAAICRRLAARGAAVGLNYVARSTEAETLRAEIVAAGGRAALLQADVADSAAVAAMFAEAEGKLGTVSILVNNAGVSARATLDTYDASELERMRAVNVNGVIHTVRAVMTGMKARNPGWIVTDMARRGASEEAFAQRVASMRERTMVGRVGAPEDIATAVAFLVEPDAGFVTAQVLTVDGGRMDYIGHG